MKSRFCSSAVTVAAAAVNEAQPRPLKRPKKKKRSPKCNSLQDSHEKSILQFSRHRGRRRRREKK